MNKHKEATACPTVNNQKHLAEFTLHCTLEQSTPGPHERQKEFYYCFQSTSNHSKRSLSIFT